MSCSAVKTRTRLVSELMKLVSLFSDHIVSIAGGGCALLLAMKAGTQAAAQALDQAAVPWAIEAVHLVAAHFFEADGDGAGLEGGQAHGPKLGVRTTQISRRVHSSSVIRITPAGFMALPLVSPSLAARGPKPFTSWLIVSAPRI